MLVLDQRVCSVLYCYLVEMRDIGLRHLCEVCANANGAAGGSGKGLVGRRRRTSYIGTD